MTHLYMLDPAPLPPPGASEEFTHFQISVVQLCCKTTTRPYGHVQHILYDVQLWHSANVQPGYPCCPAHEVEVSEPATHYNRTT
jgi:hypothetical protein